MKTLKLLIIGIILFHLNNINAQVAVNVSIDSAPQWGPVGYTEVRYYYLPDVEAYYDIETSMFIYFGGGVWIHRSSLPYQFRNYDLYGGYKVVMTDYRGNAPYNNFKEYKRKYAKGYRGGSQKTIGEHPGKGNSDKKMAPKSSSDRKRNSGNDKNIRNGNNKSNSQGNGKNGKRDNGQGKGKR